MKEATDASNLKQKSFWKQLTSKYFGIEERFVWLVGIYPQRIKRLLRHLITFQDFPKNAHNESWFMLLGIYILELFCIPEIYESISSLVKFKTRPLTDAEIELGLSIFGETIDYELIRIDEGAYFVAKPKHICYVSFHTINNWGTLSPSILIHELMHVWQYEQMGAMYIPRALKAQKTAMGYNYGGVATLQQYQDIGLSAFNLEQQADIVADYFRIKKGLKPRWGKGQITDLPIYKTYIKQVRNGEYMEMPPVVD
jgi:hypothetical protein